MMMVQGTMMVMANATEMQPHDDVPNLELKMDYTTNCAEHLSKLRDLSLFIGDATNLGPNVIALLNNIICPQGWRSC